MSDIPIIISLISLGFFGGFTHCAGMCGPFIITQVSNKLENIPIDEFSSFKKLQNLALLPYHLGRVTTYSILGLFCSLLTNNIKDFTGFKSFSAVFLFLASFIFLSLLFKKNLISNAKKRIKNKLPFKSKSLKNAPLINKVLFLKNLKFFKSFLSLLFKNPRGLKGYLLGVILGFIPCGILYGSFLLAASISSPVLAGIGMLLFGIATIPALFITASGSFIFLRILKTDFKIIYKTIILINSVTLFIMAISLIN